MPPWRGSGRVHSRGIDSTRPAVQAVPAFLSFSCRDASAAVAIDNTNHAASP